MGALYYTNYFFTSTTISITWEHSDAHTFNSFSAKSMACPGIKAYLGDAEKARRIVDL
jgi:hypothetical protein